MKNQYVGDVNDYVKYSVLRGLMRGELPLVVCWMLTEPDGRGDGRLTAYLSQPHIYRRYEPPLFDGLRELVERRRRTVGAVEESGLLDGAQFHSPTPTDNAAERQRYFDALWRASRPGSLLFFDPDNGFEVPSVLKGRRNSARYLFWDEASESYRRGHSLLVYQHFPRVQRPYYVKGLLERVAAVTGVAGPFSVFTRRVAYVFVPQPAAHEWLYGRAQALVRRWNPRLELLASALRTAHPSPSEAS
jgi:hypothetical protein